MSFNIVIEPTKIILLTVDIAAAKIPAMPSPKKPTGSPIFISSKRAKSGFTPGTTLNAINPKNIVGTKNIIRRNADHI